MTGYIPAVTGALLQELVDLATIVNGLRALHGADRLPGMTSSPAGATSGEAEYM
ncbi:heavy metal-translocating P-type ATPase [Arthrobacter nitrophenolicus]|uniref:Heavy metal-translocating P-type ATPase n=2 Tax=Arthrobacter nitrophenolicus TaxID=683150 RepID=L8TXP8_9MICC|nr:heavy metal-translocating P-type ATPase [Arthrobacter nitrophenolicus]